MAGVSWSGGVRAGTAPDVAPSPRTPADLYTQEPGEEEPAWVQTEREQFRDFRDLNKDGRLDGSEVGHWVLPPAQDQPLVEANHLLHESDTDKVRRGPRWGRVPAWHAVPGAGPGAARVPAWHRHREGPGKGRNGDLEKGADTQGWRGQGPAGHCVVPSELRPSLQDGRLSKAEILGNWNMFVGSQATNYGEDLTRHHDEL